MSDDIFYADFVMTEAEAADLDRILSNPVKVDLPVAWIPETITAEEFFGS
jgi:hypothetical protein